MILLIDIGNTSVKAALSDRDGIGHSFRIDVHREQGDNIFEKIQASLQAIGPEKPEGAVVCSVVPQTYSLVRDGIRKHFRINPLTVSPDIKTGLKFTIENPASLGADRIANAVAARHFYTGNLVIIDFGTATTVCVVSENCEYRGGSIMPGIGMSADALHDKTAGLPRTELRLPEKAIGKNTDENIRSGILYGHAGAVQRITSEVQKELNAEISIIATGGYADLVTPFLSVDYTKAMLTLEGLRLLYTMNVNCLK